MYLYKTKGNLNLQYSIFRLLNSAQFGTELNIADSEDQETQENKLKIKLIYIKKNIKIAS